MDRAIQSERKRSQVNEVKLLPAQQEKLDIVMSWLVFHQPFFAHLVMAELPVRPTKDVPVAATDGFSIFLNPDTFFKYELPEQAFVIAHEVMHCIYNDPILLWRWSKEGHIRVGNNDWPFDNQSLQIAMDFVINAKLIDSNVGRFNKAWLFDKKYSEKGNEAQVDVYQDVLRDAPNPNGLIDVILDPGAAKDDPPPEEKAKERDDLMWKQAVAAAAQAADMQGKLPGPLKQLIGEILEPKVSWQDHLRTSMMRVSGSDGIDWAQADRRMLCRGQIGHDPIFFGRSTGFGAGTVVVGADSSGSMVSMIDEIMREVRGILEDLNPREVVLIWCDAEVQRVDTLTELADLEIIRAKGAPGGGGTSFVPVFKKVDTLGLQPDMLVYLTDMFGTFPEHGPDYPVIWGSISGVKTAPFGEVVHIEV